MGRYSLGTGMRDKEEGQGQRARESTIVKESCRDIVSLKKEEDSIIVF